MRCDNYIVEAVVLAPQISYLVSRHRLQTVLLSKRGYPANPSPAARRHVVCEFDIKALQTEGFQ
jgi:hypothetical protein